MNLKQGLLDFLENNLFLKNGTCPICGKVLFVTDRFLCHTCEDALPRVNNPVCDRCGRPLFDQKRRMCTPCLKYNLPFGGGYVHFQYGGSGQKVVQAIKFGDRPRLGNWIGEQMGQGISSCTWAKEIDLIIPVPLHANRLEERGFNQSEKIANGICEGWRGENRSREKPEMRMDLLIRVQDTPHQIGLVREERLKNLMGAFDVTHASALQDKTILLVDDVLTTGATLAESAATLLEAGAKKVMITVICAKA